MYFDEIFGLQLLIQQVWTNAMNTKKHYDSKKGEYDRNA